MRQCQEKEAADHKIKANRTTEGGKHINCVVDGLNLRLRIVAKFSQQWVKVSNYIFYHKSVTFIKSALLASEVCGNVCCCVQLLVN